MLGQWASLNCAEVHEGTYFERLIESQGETLHRGWDTDVAGLILGRLAWLLLQKRKARLMLCGLQAVHLVGCLYGWVLLGVRVLVGIAVVVVVVVVLVVVVMVVGVVVSLGVVRMDGAQWMPEMNKGAGWGPWVRVVQLDGIHRSGRGSAVVSSSGICYQYWLHCQRVAGAYFAAQ